MMTAIMTPGSRLVRNAAGSTSARTLAAQFTLRLVKIVRLLHGQSQTRAGAMNTGHGCPPLGM